MMQPLLPFPVLQSEPGKILKGSDIGFAFLYEFGLAIGGFITFYASLAATNWGLSALNIVDFAINKSLQPDIALSTFTWSSTTALILWIADILNGVNHFKAITDNYYYTAMKDIDLSYSRFFTAVSRLIATFGANLFFSGFFASGALHVPIENIQSFLLLILAPPALATTAGTVVTNVVSFIRRKRNGFIDSQMAIKAKLFALYVSKFGDPFDPNQSVITITRALGLPVAVAPVVLSVPAASHAHVINRDGADAAILPNPCDLPSPRL